MPIYGEGKNSREWIYVDDHCEALLKIFNKGKKGETYNIGSNKNLKNIDVCKNLLKIAHENKMLKNKVKIKYVKDRPGHDIRYALNSNKIRDKMKWKPKTKFYIGLKKTFKWYLNNINYYKNLKKNDITNRLGLTK